MVYGTFGACSILKVLFYLAEVVASYSLAIWTVAVWEAWLRSLVAKLCVHAYHMYSKKQLSYCQEWFAV